MAIFFVECVCLKEKDGQKELADQTRKQPAEQCEVDVSAADRGRPPREDTGRDTVTVSSPAVKNHAVLYKKYNHLQIGVEARLEHT